MKKTLKTLLFFFALASLAACGKKVEKNLPGEWQVTGFRFNNNPAWNTPLDIHSYSFNSDGTGRYLSTAPGSTPIDFTWSGDDKTYVTIGGTEFHVLTNTRQKQEWERVIPNDSTFAGVQLARLNPE